MGDKMSESRSAEAWRLARRQHGVVTRRDLLGLGFSPKAIQHRMRTGRLHPVTAGIYLVGRPELTPEVRWMAAVLACGEGAVLSHRSAGALWRIAGERRGERVNVSVRRASEARRAGLKVHRRPTLSVADVGSHRGIPITKPIQTLVDLATELPRNRLERAVNEADKLDLVDPGTLRAALEGRSGQPGVRVLRDLLDRHTFRLSDSELEVLFRPLAAAAGLSPPMTMQRVNGFEVDFFFPDLGLVVETDGWRYHRTPAAQTRDAVRDQTHTAAGIATLRFSHHQVKYEPTYVRRVLARTANVSRGRPAPLPAE